MAVWDKQQWDLAIRRNRDDLLRIVAALFAMAGLIGVASVETLPRRVHRRILLVLRPAESAVRRLIVIAAREALFTPDTPEPDDMTPEEQAEAIAQFRRDRIHAKWRAAHVICREVNLGLANWSVPSAPAKHAPPVKAGTATSEPTFALLDPLKRFGVERRHYASSIPRVTNILTHTGAWPEIETRSEPLPDDPVGAKALCRRLQALKAALDDIDGHAQRLARMKARAERPNGKRRCFSPMRPGYPPGYRRRHIHDVDEVLRECHGLVTFAEKDSRAPPGTATSGYA
jgi:hypothetical protein